MFRQSTRPLLAFVLSVAVVSLGRPPAAPAASAPDIADRAAAALADAAGADPLVRTAVVTAALSDATAGDDGWSVPAGTLVERVECRDGVGYVDLTFPEGTPDTFLPDAWADAFAEILAQAAAGDDVERGVIVRARIADGEYRPLDSFRFTFEPVAERAPSNDPALSAAIEPGAPAGPAARTGPVGNAGHQPAGALSGVVVYAAAGHGWTAGSSSWFLQRPLLLNMIEDYGNLDQLNYFVNYAFNAGATVVALRPVGYQPLEVVLDQDDPGVVFSGAWSTTATPPYYENGTTASGVAYKFVAASPTETASVRYTPNLPTTDYYPVYTWVLDHSNRTTQLYRVHHSGGTTEVVVDHRMVGRGWVWLGSYYFHAGTSGYVEISNESSAGGYAIADAIRFGNGTGDVVGAGPGTVSGYPREEEAQRYWAESEAYLNVAGGSSSIFNCCTLDQDDNVGTGARWAASMNNTTFNADRWRRIYIEFHTNASSGSTKGTLALVTGSPTTYQTQYATILGDEIEQDMQILDGSEFEYTWGSLSNPLNGSYGAISTSNNGNEFDATILEVAFHDNAQDAAMLLDPKVRSAVGRSSVHGIVKFLNTLPGSQIPLNFAPAEPRFVRAEHDGAGGVIVAWSAPQTGEAYGGAPTGYRVYRSTDGYGFDAGVDVGNVAATTLLDVPANTTTFFRVAAYNAGGESMPSATVAVRRASHTPGEYLIVNGFDRVGRAQDPAQTLSGVGTQRRPILRKVNAFDYVVQQAQALADAGMHFDSCENDNVIAGNVALGDYGAVTWILGEESTADDTFNPTEQALVTAYLNGGGNLFVSGAEIGWDLDAQGAGAAFYNSYLKADYAGDDAGTYNVAAAPGSIFAGIGAFSFDDGTLYYDAEYPDQLAATGGSTVALTYVGGAGGNAAVVYSGAFKVVNFGFPFETITSAARRSELMNAIVAFFGVLPAGPGIADLVDCLSGPGGGYLSPACADVDFDVDVDVDLVDFHYLQQQLP